ncbi:MAG: ABC transporter permease [Legionellales bacterium]|jgi:phospholipid/cholesterol/gamma-HCH transport system permease protein
MFFETKSQKDQLDIALIGPWTVAQLAEIELALEQLAWSKYQTITINAEQLTILDTAGAWLLKQFIEQIKSAKKTVNLLNIHPKQASIYHLIEPIQLEEEVEKPAGSAFINVIVRLGEGAVNAFKQMLLLLSFIGQVCVTLGHVILNPKKIRLTSIIRHMDETGINAIPIVALMAFLTSVVLAYQGATQLRQFGAEIFTIDLVAISILREMGVLLTAIMVAGRSGSAFAAEIGVMQVNEEIDAMRTLGLNPFEILVVPRVLALILVLPILTFVADMTGLLGAAMMSILLLDITLTQFLVRAHAAVGLWTFGVGMIKAPFFAFIIATIGCLKGMQVTGSAEKVGEMTTSAVVQAIFVVILADAIFSIIFSKMGI